jgi:hypothetical protein
MARKKEKTEGPPEGPIVESRWPNLEPGPDWSWFSEAPGGSDKEVPEADRQWWRKRRSEARSFAPSAPPEPKFDHDRTPCCPCGARLEPREQPYPVCRISGWTCCSPACCQRAYLQRVTELLTRARRWSTEPECIKAIRNLRHELRLQVAEFRRGKRALVDPLLDQWAGDCGRRLFAEDDPGTALMRLLGKKHKPGKHAINAARDQKIARDVFDKMMAGQGMTLEDAAAEVAKVYRRSAKTVRDIYIRGHIEVKAGRHRI